jgi:hypothetical protein
VHKQARPLGRGRSIWCSQKGGNVLLLFSESFSNMYRSIRRKSNQYLLCCTSFLWSAQTTSIPAIQVVPPDSPQVVQVIFLAFSGREIEPSHASRSFATCRLFLMVWINDEPFPPRAFTQISRHQHSSTISVPSGGHHPSVMAWYLSIPWFTSTHRLQRRPRLRRVKAMSCAVVQAMSLLLFPAPSYRRRRTSPASTSKVLGRVT